MANDMTMPETATAELNGILPMQSLRAYVRDGAIQADAEFDDDQIQPASIDLRLGPVAHRVRASFLPGSGRTVADQLDRLAMHTIDLAGGAVLERGCVYIVPLMESLKLPAARRRRPLPTPRVPPDGSISSPACHYRLCANEFDHIRAAATRGHSGRKSPHVPSSILVRSQGPA